MMTINRFRYLIRNSLRSIGGNRSAYATLYVANILGLLLPLLVFGFSTYAYRAITDKHPIDIERVAVVGLPWLRLGEDLKSSILEAIPAIEECCDQFSFGNMRSANMETSIAQSRSPMPISVSSTD